MPEDLLPEDQKQYEVPNRAVPLTIVASKPINENWNEIEEALNKNYELAEQVVNKIDISEKGIEGGVATLDINNKLTISQLPEEAKGHAYEVNNLVQQLSLDAHSGDICVRKDIQKTYSLKIDDPTQFSNWIEIASSNAGGEVGGNPVYTNTFKKNDWSYEDNQFVIKYSNIEHGQGSHQFIFVTIRNDLGEEITCDTTVDTQGNVVLYTQNPFVGSVMISNLEGNCNNLNYIPYSVYKGAYNNLTPNLFATNINVIKLITSPTIVLIDGFNIVRNIDNANDLSLPDNIQDGNYILFADSSNIDGQTLNTLSYIKKQDYLGVQKELPSNATENQRCYIVYGKSYHYSKGNWSPKAFVPLGEFTTKSGIITNIITYPYNQNGVTVNYESHSLDRLFGNKIEGLELNFNENILTVESGKCLIDNQLVTTSTITKIANQAWGEGNKTGALDISSTITQVIVYEVEKQNQKYYVQLQGNVGEYVDVGQEVYRDEQLTEQVGEAQENEYMYTGANKQVEKEVSGWGNIFLITNYYKYDIILTMNETPTLTDSFTNYRKIGYFYIANNIVKNMKQFKDTIYFKEPFSVVKPLSTTLQNIEIDIPQNTEIIINYNINNQQEITFNFDTEITTYVSKITNNTITIPYTNNLLVKGELADTLTLKVLGYKTEV